MKINKLKWFLCVLLVLSGISLWSQGHITPQVEINCVVVRIHPDTAAQWGLDGGPAADPKQTPLGKDIPKILDKEDYRKLFTAIRKSTDSEIVASVNTTVQSGVETYVGKCFEARFIESYDYPEDLNQKVVKLLEKKDGTIEIENIAKEGEKKKETETQNNLILIPEYGEARDDLGISLTVTPTVSPDYETITLELTPKLIKAFQHINGQETIFDVFDVRTILTLKNNQTSLIGMTKPSKKSLHLIKNKDPKQGYPQLMFISVKLAEIEK